MPPVYINNRETAGQGTPRIAQGSAAPVYGIFGYSLVGSNPVSSETEIVLAQRYTVQYSVSYALKVVSMSAKATLTMYMKINGVNQGGTEAYGTSVRDEHATINLVGTTTLDAGTYTFQAGVDPSTASIEQYGQFSGYILVGANSESSCEALLES